MRVSTAKRNQGIKLGKAIGGRGRVRLPLNRFLAGSRPPMDWFGGSLTLPFWDLYCVGVYSVMDADMLQVSLSSWRTAPRGKE